MFGLKVKPIDFYGEGEKVLWLEFKDIYEVYHHDALDVSLISAWVCKCPFIYMETFAHIIIFFCVSHRTNFIFHFMYDANSDALTRSVPPYWLHRSIRS